jgi:hypothetical protein
VDVAAKLTSKGQVTVPKAARDALGDKPLQGAPPAPASAARVAGLAIGMLGALGSVALIGTGLIEIELITGGSASSVYAVAMSIASGPAGHQLVVADDGSIPAEQIARLGMRPGTHLPVVVEEPPAVEGSIAGRLTSWPDVSWEDFTRASRLAQADLGHRPEIEIRG